ncbi:sushi, von Willebrand factor type A, EGF and pentraxin domain-containing protein 1 [Trichonephila clavipes]|uniref:Sushi, von Willebrand factor type A, EGF and pentraxin domain-containing protein 1 n=1 Tax=Trichonephila clavipes TaxID=2585209 RepID=A0A8X6RPT7_TRICX|nr:sushi, von Willebrand factor type A, EGF and pentraxin domain-containing protein 1 [Trichonephila clavipes]
MLVATVEDLALRIHVASADITSTPDLFERARQSSFRRCRLYYDLNGKCNYISLQSHQSGHKFSQGRHTVTYRAVDLHNNEAVCNFDVIMTRNTCPYYPPPTNGALSCNDWLFGEICQVFCNERYDFVEKPAEWYVCNEISQWITDPPNMHVPWPDCATRAIPNKIRHMMRGFYYQGDCSDPNVQAYLKKKFLQHLSEKFEKAELCLRQGTCSLNTVRVLCGNTTDHARRKRDVWEHIGGEEVELEFEITIDVDQELNDTEAVIQNFLETIQNLKWDMDEDFVLQPTMSSPFPLSDSQFSHQNESIPGSVVFTEGETTLECKPGSVPNDDLCASQCGGYFKIVTFDNGLPLCETDVEETVDPSEPVNSDSGVEIDETSIKTVTFSNALHCLEAGKTYLMPGMVKQWHAFH